MPEWLPVSANGGDLGWLTLVARMALAALIGLVVAGVYALTQRRPAGQSITFIFTLVLLTMLVAMTTIVIGDSVARAFGLVGALSIVRFRTVVEDTRDTSFVIFAVVAGMAIGAGNLVMCLVGVPAVSLAAIGLTLGSTALQPVVQRRLEVRVGAGRDPEQLLNEVFRAQLHSWKLTSLVSARQGAALDLVYQIRLRDRLGMLTLVKAIHGLEGVQSVELRED
jgi:hypothetical protein